jgi:hypothetical protein
MVIRFTARTLAMPQLCACCAAEATSVLPLVVKRGAYEIPYCKRCRDHVVARRRLWSNAIGVAFGVAILAAISVALIEGRGPSVAATLVGVAFAVWLLGTLRHAMRTKRMGASGCIRSSDGVIVARDERNSIELVVHSRPFAAHLLAANAQIVADLGDEERQLMAWGASRAANVPRRITAA